MEITTYRPQFIEGLPMNALGYKKTKDEKGCLVYESVGGRAVKRIGQKTEQVLGDGQRIITINTNTFEPNRFYLGIKCDGGTRTIFKGTCDTQEFFLRLLDMCD